MNENSQDLHFDASTRGLVARLWRDWLRPYWRRIAGALLLMVVSAGATGLYPVLINWSIELYEAREMGAIYFLPPAIIAVTTTRALSLYFHTVTTQSVSLRVVADLRKAMFAHLLSADLARISREPAGIHVSRFINDVTLLHEAMSRCLTNLIADLLTLAALVAAMIYLDWVLSLIVFLVFPFAAIPVDRIGRRLRQVSGESQVNMGELTTLLHESLAGNRMVKTYRLESYEKGRANRAFEKIYGLYLTLARNQARMMPLFEVLGGIAVAGVVAFIGYRVASGSGTLGQIAGFIGALLIAGQHTRSLGALTAILQSGLAAVQRIFLLIDEEPAIVDAPDAVPLAPGAGLIELKDVRFRYEADADVLKSVSLRVEPGKTVALVGPSGAGKSTVFNLIPRLFDVDGGAVTIDGQDVREVTLESLRTALALVSQDVVLFNDTVRANIAFGRMDAGDKEIEAAARAAAAHDFIEGLSGGYATVVGDRGAKLSGGERQRIALARAMLRDARILLLDEATSALDAESEKQVQDALARLTFGRTTIVIAHRLATVRNADWIYVMDKGEIVEQGAHDDLLAQGGLYSRLCRLQFFTDETDVAL